MWPFRKKQAVKWQMTPYPPPGSSQIFGYSRSADGSMECYNSWIRPELIIDLDEQLEKARAEYVGPPQ